MIRGRRSLSAIIGMANLVVIGSVTTFLITYWFWLATPLMQAGERTKTELLATSYADQAVAAVESGERDRIEAMAGELALLNEPDSGRPIIARVEVELSSGDVVASGDDRSTLGINSFQVEIPLFSETTFEHMGTLRVFRDIGLYEQAVVFWSTAAVILVMMFIFQALLWSLLEPLRRLSSNVEHIDADSLTGLPDPEGFVTREIHQVTDSLRRLLGRLDEARRLTENQKNNLAEHARELERSNRDLEQFAYVASHDLKAPLRGIANLADWLEEDLGEKLEGDSREYMDLLKSRVTRLERLLEDLLAYSRVGRADVAIVVVDSGEIVGHIIDELAPPEGFEIIVQPDMPTFETAPGPLGTVFRNLLGNAIKHHDRSDGRIEVTWRSRDGFYEFAVTDDGPGIDPEFHARALQMFQTLRRRDEVEGSGMGLAIVKKMVESQRGRIHVESGGAGKGTTMRFSWPQTWRRKPLALDETVIDERDSTDPPGGG